MRFAREIRLRRVKCASRVLECGLGSEMGFVCEVPGAFFVQGVLENGMKMSGETLYSGGNRKQTWRRKTGGMDMKRILMAILAVMALLALLTVSAAGEKLTVKEVLEQVAVPLALENDTENGVQEMYTAEQLKRLVDALEENGIILEENEPIMQGMLSGQGYYEEEAIMEICRREFGGNLFTWSLEDQDWFGHLMAKIGFYETYESFLPGEGTMSYAEAEAFFFNAVEKEYGAKVDPANREKYLLEKQFYLDSDNAVGASWIFTLMPRNVEDGTYYAGFEDADPEGTLYVYANIPDWTHTFSGDDVMYAFYNAYSWFENKWSQPVMHKLHEMMAKAELDPESYDYPKYRGYQLTDYPEPAEGEISREDAVRMAKEVLKAEKSAMDSAVLAEYEGERVWLVTVKVYPADETQEVRKITLALDSAAGTVLSQREWTEDDDDSLAYVPEKAYEKAREGRLKRSEYIRLAAETVQKTYPEMDLLNEEEYEVSCYAGRWYRVVFQSKNIRHGNVAVNLNPDGTVDDITADTEELTGDNLMDRYRMVYDYFGQWDQSIWVQLSKDLEGLEAAGIEAELLKMGKFPEESSVKIGHEEAKTIAVKDSGKRYVEINTCVLISAEPHPVWKMRLITDTPEDSLIELDAETGEITARETFKTDYTPIYVLYSLEKNWRKAELETQGPVGMAKREAAYRYMDMWQDFPDEELDNPNYYETEVDGLTVRFIGRWAGMKNYLTEFDANGYVVRCEESDSESTQEMPEEEDYTGLDGADYAAIFYPPDDAPEPREDGKPWVWGMDYAPAEYWEQLDRTMQELGIHAGNLIEKQLEWADEYGDRIFWTQEMTVCADTLCTTPQMVEESNGQFTYPVFPAPGKKTEAEIQAIAEEHMRAELVPEMGEDWVSQLRYGSCLWNRSYLPDEQKDLDEHCWVCQFFRFETWNADWNAKYYLLINEDGEVLFSEFWENGNG